MSHFFAYMARMKFIARWGLMRNTRQENIQEHSLQVAMIAHALAAIHNKLYPELGLVDANRIAILAVYHEAGEVITGDLATPIKYFNPDIKKAYKDIEKVAVKKLYDMIPKVLQDVYEPLLSEFQTDDLRFVKAADKISAYLKCVEELKAGNQEFEKAAVSIQRCIEEMQMPEVRYFMETFVPSFSLTIDELN